jgi:hypothetical protein
MKDELYKKAAVMLRKLNDENMLLKTELAKIANLERIEKLAYKMMNKGVPGWDRFESYEDKLTKMSSLMTKNLDALEEAITMYNDQQFLKLGMVGGDDVTTLDPLTQFVFSD